MAILPPDYPTDAIAAFAFLKTRQQLSIDDLKVLALLECYGDAFYQQIARGVTDEPIRALLLRNAQEERGHAHRVLKAITMKGGNFELPADEDNPYIEATSDDLPVSMEFMTMLQQAESDGDLQYQQWADEEPDAEVAKLFRQNGREETRHGERVNEVKRLLETT